MALATEIIGNGILVSLNVSIRKYAVKTILTVLWVTETTHEEIREWVALTQAIAESTAEAAVQPSAPAVATYVASEDNRVVGSYKLTKTTTTKTISYT